MKTGQQIQKFWKGEADMDTSYAYFLRKKVVLWDFMEQKFYGC